MSLDKISVLLAINSDFTKGGKKNQVEINFTLNL